MRKLLLASMLFAGVLANAQKEKKEIVGSGNLVTKDVAVKPFSEVHAKGVLNVVLKQGDKEEVKIEAEDNLQQYIHVTNDGDKLNISMEKDLNYSSKKSMKVYVTFKKLKSMDLSTVGSVSSDEALSFGDLSIKHHGVGSVNLNMSANNVDLEHTGVGSVKLKGKAENAVFRNSGVGSISASQFVVQKMDITNSGIGSAEVNAEKEIKVLQNSMGRVKNTGKAVVKKKVVI